jgi:hypothetical protein
MAECSEVICAAALLRSGFLFSSLAKAPPSEGGVLRGTYYYAKTLDKDTTSFATFASQATGDTASWSATRRVEGHVSELQRDPWSAWLWHRAVPLELRGP